MNDPVSVPGSVMSPVLFAKEVVVRTLVVVDVAPLKANEPATNAAALAPVVARAITAAPAAKIEILFSMLVPLCFLILTRGRSSPTGQLG